MANLKSEQLTNDFTIDINYDQPLSFSKMTEKMINILGKDNCHTEKIDNKKVFFYKHEEKTEVLLLASITYLGGNGQHPIFKKRMQLKKWYKDIIEYYKDKQNYTVRFIGVYHYEENIIFTEFIKDSYIKKKMNSSAAHVYINDLYQAMKNGIFKKTDRNKNKLVTIKDTKLKEYLDGHIKGNTNELFSIFKQFNQESCFNKWITAKEAITEMYDNNWGNWKETEWAGIYLEFKMNSFIKKNKLENQILYVGSSHKKKEDLDFDLWFDKENFFGDLKASNNTKLEAPGNDQIKFTNCINKYTKFWYVIYEHDTIKDTKENNYEATRFRANFIKEKNEWKKNKPFDELSYYSRMKHSIRFTNMEIIELNPINYQEVLGEFKQGRQPNGDARKPKFKIPKKNIDNFIVFNKDFLENENEH